MSHLTSVARGNGTSTSLQYDLASRLTALNHTMASQSQALSFNYTTASQLLTRTSSNASYDFAPAEASTAYTANGLNELASVAGTAYGSDGRGNLTSAGARTMTYDLENRLLSVVGGAGKTCLFFNFAASTVLDALAKLKVTARRCPRSCAVRSASFTEQDRPVSEDEDSDSWLRRIRIGAHAPSAALERRAVAKRSPKRSAPL
jgi:YD repeat-containing protein